MKPHPLQNIQFLFFTQKGEHFQKNAPDEDMLSMLYGIDGFLNPENQVVKLFEAALKEYTDESNADLPKNVTQLLYPLKSYAAHCLSVCKKNKNAAYKKFIKDLCVSYASIDMHVFQALSKFPPYQISDLLLEGIREFLKNSALKDYSLLHDPKGEKYGYARIFKIILAIYLFYAELMVNWKTSLPCSVLMTMNQLLEWPNHPFLQAALNEIVPLAIYVGMHVASIDAPLTSVCSYATLGYVFVRSVQGAFSLASKALGSNSLLGHYFQNQLVYSGASYLFQHILPPNDWLVTRCFNDPVKRAAAEKLLNISADATPSQIRKQYHQLSREFWAQGNPIDHDKTTELNLAYKCLFDGR